MEEMVGTLGGRMGGVGVELERGEKITAIEGLRRPFKSGTEEMMGSLSGQMSGVGVEKGEEITCGAVTK
jgi:hypothetical protein